MHSATPPEVVVDLTRDSAWDRASDGWPLVSDDILKRMRKVTTEEVWVTVCPCASATSASRSFVMIRSTVCRRRACASPFPGPALTLKVD